MFQLIVHKQEKLERKPIFCFFDKLGNIQLFIDFHPVSTLDAILFYKVVCRNCFRTGTGTDFQCSPPTYKYSYSARIYQIDYNKIQSQNRGYPFIFNGQSHGKKRIQKFKIVSRKTDSKSVLVPVLSRICIINNLDFGR